MDEEYLAKLKNVRQMEKEAKDVFGKYMNALNSTNQDDDIVNILELKMEALRIAEADLESKNNEINKWKKDFEELQVLFQRLKTKGESDKTKYKASLASSEKVINEHRKKAKEQEQALQAESKKNNELSAVVDEKSMTILKLEEECLKMKAELHQLESVASEKETLEARHADAVMALQFEIKSIQKELDGNKKAELVALQEIKEAHSKQLAAKHEEIEGLKNRVGEANKTMGQYEKDIFEMKSSFNDKVSTMNQLHREKQALEDAVQSHLVKINKQQYANQELNELLGKMQSNLMSNQHEVSSLLARVNSADERIKQLQGENEHLADARDQMESRWKESDSERTRCMSELVALRSAQEHFNQQLSDHKRTQQRLERVEAEKNETLLELTSYNRQLNDLQNNTLTLQSEKKAMVEANEALEKVVADLTHRLEAVEEEWKDKYNESQELASSLQKQLVEMDRNKEKLAEIYKTQQKESAARLIDYSTKHTSATTEISLLEEKLEECKRNYIFEKNEILQKADQEKHVLQHQYNELKTRVQDSEDSLEEMKLKYVSVQEDCKSYKQALEELKEDNLREKEEWKNKSKEECLKACKELSDEYDSKIERYNTLQDQLKLSHEVELSKIREEHNSQVEELHSAYKQEIAEGRNRLTMTIKSLEYNNIQVRDEEKGKYNQLLHECEGLKKHHQMELDQYEEKLANVEREKGREKVRLENNIIALNEQMADLSSLQAQREGIMTTLEQQILKEREGRYAALQKARVAEEDAEQAASEMVGLKQDIEMLKRQLKEIDRTHSLLLQTKEAEISRLVKRNQMLNDSMTRLASNSTAQLEHAMEYHSDRTPRGTPNTARTYRSDTTEVRESPRMTQQQSQQPREGANTSQNSNPQDAQVDGSGQFEYFAQLLQNTIQDDHSITTSNQDGNEPQHPQRCNGATQNRNIPPPLPMHLLSATEHTTNKRVQSAPSYHNDAGARNGQLHPSSNSAVFNNVGSSHSSGIRESRSAPLKAGNSRSGDNASDSGCAQSNNGMNALYYEDTALTARDGYDFEEYGSQNRMGNEGPRLSPHETSNPNAHMYPKSHTSIVNAMNMLPPRNDQDSSASSRGSQSQYQSHTRVSSAPMAKTKRIMGGSSVGNSSISPHRSPFPYADIEFDEDRVNNTLMKVQQALNKRAHSAGGNGSVHNSPSRNAGMFTPSSPIHNDHSNSNSRPTTAHASGSGSAYSDRMRSTVEKTKDLMLPFSPDRNRNLSRTKSTPVIGQSGGNYNSDKPGPGSGTKSAHDKRTPTRSVSDFPSMPKFEDDDLMRESTSHNEVYYTSKVDTPHGGGASTRMTVDDRPKSSKPSKLSYF